MGPRFFVGSSAALGVAGAALVAGASALGGCFIVSGSTDGYTEAGVPPPPFDYDSGCYTVDATCVSLACTSELNCPDAGVCCLDINLTVNGPNVTTQSIVGHCAGAGVSTCNSALSLQLCNGANVGECGDASACGTYHCPGGSGMGTTQVVLGACENPLLSRLCQ